MKPRAQLSLSRLSSLSSVHCPVLGLALSVMAVAAPGCGGAMNPVGTTTAAVTFHKDVEPILQQHCQNCHSEGHIGPIALTDYATAKTFSAMIADKTASRTMPPWGASSTSTCKPRYPWKGDVRLSDAEIATLGAWHKAGAPEGDVADAPPAKMFPADGLPGMTMQLEPKKPFVAGGTRDQFRCFVIDPGFTKPVNLNGFHIVAGNAKVVHHALVFLDTDGAASRAKADADGGYDCFGGPAIATPRLIGAWAPGSVPTELPPNVATTIPAGAVFVMQVHYHPAGLSNQSDSTKFQMRFIPFAPEYQLLISLIGNFPTYDAKTGDGLLPDAAGKVEFRIPANDPAKKIDMQFTVPAMIAGIATPEFRIMEVGTHMHYVGQDMTIGIERTAATATDPQSECLLETPAWDFNWQRAYTYDVNLDTLPRAHGGDKLKLSCTYNNTMTNPLLAAALQSQSLSAPHDVSLGETTLDEMCLAVFGSIYKP